MKINRLLVSGLIIIVLVFMAAVPGALAQDPAAIIFHVMYSHNMTVPEDSPDEIKIEGVFIGIESGSASVMIQNLCEGAGCSSQDIYYKIEMLISWTSDWGHDYPTWLTAPKIHYVYGADNLITETSDYCGGPTGNMGSCIIETEGMIPASQVDPNPDPTHTPGPTPTPLAPPNPDPNPANYPDHAMESFLVGYLASYGGLHITNSYKIIFSTSPIGDQQALCAGQYVKGAILGQVTINSKVEAGVDLRQYLGSKYPAPGTWYIVQVTYGSWQNNGSGAALKDIGLKVGVNGYWFPLGTNPSVECVSGDTYYLQMSSSLGSTYLRAYDTDGNWAANNGSMTVTIINVAARTQYLNGCELQYQIGDFIEQGTVTGDRPDGILIKGPDKLSRASGGDGLMPYEKKYYMLETIGGPANLGTDGFSYDVDLGLREHETKGTPDEWYQIGTAPFVECVHSTDMAGHYKVFIAADEKLGIVGAENIKEFYYSFRVRDTGSYDDNSGYMSYRLYQATYLQVTPPGEIPTPGGCDLFSHDVADSGSISINGNDDDGTLFPSLIPNGLYALVVTGGPWKDNSVDSYSIQISDDNGDVWTDLKDYTNLLCAASQDGQHITIYLYLAAGKQWRARVDDGDSNFGNNTQAIGLKFYVGLSGIHVWNPCTGYILSMVTLTEEQRKIPGNSESGKDLVGSLLGARGPLISGGTYALEITDESKWLEAGAGLGSYLVDISDDNGSSWVALESYPGLCTEQLGEGGRYRVYFTAQSSQYKLRVRDGDNNFLSNTGSVLFKLYTANPDDAPPGDDIAPPEWVVACNESYSRPDSFITMVGIIPVPRVGEWLDYLRSAITYYFAWCPQHTEALLSTQDVYLDKEPLASIQDFILFVRGIQIQITSAMATGGDSGDGTITSMEPDLFSDNTLIGVSGGDTYKVPSTSGPWDLFMVGNQSASDSIWFGGQLDLTSNLGSSNTAQTAAYRRACSIKFYPLFGIGADPYCALMGTLRFTSIITWLLLGLDLFIVIWFFIKYIPGYVMRIWNLITGHKSDIKGLIS